MSAKLRITSRDWPFASRSAAYGAVGYPTAIHPAGHGYPLRRMRTHPYRNGLNAADGLWHEITTSGSASAHNSTSGSRGGGY